MCNVESPQSRESRTKSVDPLNKLEEKRNFHADITKFRDNQKF